MAKTGEPVKLMFPLNVGEPGKVPENVPPLYVVAVSALTVIEGVPNKPAALPV